MAKYATAHQIDQDVIGSDTLERAETPVIDLVHLSRQTLGDNALEIELLTLFDRQAQQFASRLGAPMTPGEGKWRAELAHTLKGSARAVGAFALGEAAEAYEEAIRAEAPDLALTWRRLATAIGRAHGEIAGLL